MVCSRCKTEYSDDKVVCPRCSWAEVDVDKILGKADVKNSKLAIVSMIMSVVLLVLAFLPFIRLDKDAQKDVRNTLFPNGIEIVTDAEGHTSVEAVEVETETTANKQWLFDFDDAEENALLASRFGEISEAKGTHYTLYNLIFAVKDSRGIVFIFSILMLIALAVIVISQLIFLFETLVNKKKTKLSIYKFGKWAMLFSGASAAFCWLLAALMDDYMFYNTSLSRAVKYPLGFINMEWSGFVMIAIGAVMWILLKRKNKKAIALIEAERQDIMENHKRSEA